LGVRHLDQPRQGDADGGGGPASGGVRAGLVKTPHPRPHRSAQKHVFYSESVKSERVEPPEGAFSPLSDAPEHSFSGELGRPTIEHPFLGTPMPRPPCMFLAEVAGWQIVAPRVFETVGELGSPDRITATQSPNSCPSIELAAARLGVCWWCHRWGT